MQTIDETPDDTRPRNVWPRLLMTGVLALIALLVLGTCVALYVGSVPSRDLRIEAGVLEPGLPRLLPVTTWGGDVTGRTYGAWVILLEGGRGPRAYLSLDPHSGCHVRWEGAFVDPCEGTRYDEEGAVSGGPASRGLDRFAVQIRDGVVIVDVERVELGLCATSDTAGCSTEGEREHRNLPRGPLRR